VAEHWIIGLVIKAFGAAMAAGKNIDASLANYLKSILSVVLNINLVLAVLRSFRVNDFVQAGGVTGTVREIGLFGTTIVTPDNVMTIVGNNKIFSESIQNYSTLLHRRVDCLAKVANSVDPLEAIARLRPAIAAIPQVMKSPAPDIEILQFTPEGPLLAVRPYRHTDHYWQVYFDTRKAVVATFGAAGYPVPETALAPRNRG